MVPDVILDWLQHNERYTKIIVHLAGLLTADVPGFPVEVAVWWDGDKFIPPVHLSIVNNVGRIVWTHTEEAPKLYERSLEILEETFREMVIPARMIVMGVVLSNETKKVHFKFLKFFDKPFPTLPQEKVILTRRTWPAEELEVAIQQLRKMKRKLRGLGYG